MPRRIVYDAQAAMSFLVQQATYIEAEVYRTQYPEIQYPLLTPVDESAPEWAKSVTYYSIDHVGQAAWFHHMATDMRLADVSRAVSETGVEMAGIGYRYTLEELGQAMMIGYNLAPERAAAARRAYEEFVERIAFSGDTDKAWSGLINNATVTTGNVAAGATDTEWSTKTADEILFDVNNGLSSIHTVTQTVEMANTILLPIEQYNLIATKRLSDLSEMTILEWLMRYNVYTAQTGQPLVIRAVPRLEGAGAGATDRMVIYRRDPGVVKMHIPMRHRFLPVWQTGPITFDVPGIFRLGGVEIRRPGAFRYYDAI